MTSEDALLATILANPDDDTARLVYADHLDESGDERKAERAKLIRHQCDDPDGEQVSLTFSNIYGHDLSRTGPPYLVLWGRGPKTKELAAFAACSTNQVWRAIADSSLSSRATYRRGFVESVSCPWDAWRDHGDAILARHPVTKVRLTDWPWYETLFVDDHNRYGLLIAGQRYVLETDLIGRRSFEAAALSARWPTVREWELPEEEVDPMFHAFYGSNRREGAITVNEARAIRARR